ncbi:MAG: hypothetical protein KGI28_00555 [Thaumarchaeota archaeon]|nr:hypothetical protein [Nitrososphaerota archaeon]
MDRNTLIQVNAIIIAGLLILLSLQSLSSPIYETQVIDSLKRMADDGIQFNKINNLYNEHCVNPLNSTFTFLNSTDVKNMCKQWEVQKDEQHQEGLVLYKYLVTWGVLKNNMVTPSVWTLIWAPMFAKITVAGILLPFIFSISYEVLRKSPDGNVSRLSVVSFAIGMGLLFIGLIIFMLATNSTAPWNNFNYTKS